MANIHVILQGKGGVGKSFIAAILSQYLRDKGCDPKKIDTDPQNATFSTFKALNVEHVRLIENKEINTRNFDVLIEMIAGLEVDAVIDNGSNSFFQLVNYLISNKVPQLIKSFGHTMVIHTPITGGQALLETLSGFTQLAEQMPEEAKFVVWLNPFWGAVAHDGKTFEQMKAYKDNKDRVAAIVNVPDVKAETYGKDMSDMLKEHLTFDEVDAMASLSIMTRQRLRLMKVDIYAQLNAATVI